MQTFLPYRSFLKSAEALDRKRLRKQVVETKQILKSLIGDWSCSGTKKSPHTPISIIGTDKRCVLCNKLKPWRHHPAVLMWEGYEGLLSTYGITFANVLKERFGEDNIAINYLREVFANTHYSPVDFPEWLGDENLHASHRSNLLRKDPEYYGQFGWKESHDLPYIWPARRQS